MHYPNLLIAIRESGLRQYEVAREAGIREGRLSEIVRRGGAKDHERERLSGVLGWLETFLFRQS